MKNIYACIAGLFMPLLLSAHSDLFRNDDALLKRFTDKPQQLNEAYQKELRNRPEWQKFSTSNPGWYVQFNETNGKPHRAYGRPQATGITATPEATALYFLQNKTADWLPSSVQLVHSGTTTTSKYIQPNFKQFYNGLEVLWSRATVKLTTSNEPLMFGLDVYDDIAIPVTPSLSANSAVQSALANVPVHVVSATVDPKLKVLPVPSYHSNVYHLVYAVNVKTRDAENIPADYYTLVDAMNGDVLYRQNRVNHFSPTDVNVTGTVYPTNPYNPSQVLPLQYIEVAVPGNVANADVNGYAGFSNASPVTATITLQGPWVNVLDGVSGSVVPSLTATLNPGSNTVSFDAATSIRHISAYYHTNVVHDFMKTKLPGFTDMDNSMIARVDRTDGNCNAFWDGNINFYSTSNGCNALSQVGDVVYHEYGHGISHVYYAANGSSFDNGGMGEGYSDVWAMSITGDPVLGIGFSSSDPNQFIRTYDFVNGAPRKVYPQDLAGEPHADGEIIAGAWWSTSLQLGSLTAMTDLFAESLAGLATGPDGTEGQVYMDILLDALAADDNDADLTNGTPNGLAIATAFAEHGITLLTNATLAHTPVETAPSNAQIQINATLGNMQFAWAFAGLKCYYKVNATGSWNTINMTSLSPTSYTCAIPPQPAGTVVSYYLAMQDVNSFLSNVEPAGANDPDPNIPYYIMVDFDFLSIDDFDNNGGNWSLGSPTDNATTGIWEVNMPQTTTVNNFTVVQPGSQHTPGGLFCFVTEAAAGATAGAGDIDNGKTTIETPVYDLSGHSNPAFEYYRWYSNDQGATPGTDYWQVSVSNDGINYVPVENTLSADHSWRRFVFRVKDYVPLSNNVTIRFVAEDANAGSLVEALVDDLSLYDIADETAVGENSMFTAAVVKPNPANELLTLNCTVRSEGAFKVTITDQPGRVISSSTVKLNAGQNEMSFHTSDLSSGLYHLLIQQGNVTKAMKFSVMH